MFSYISDKVLKRCFTCILVSFRLTKAKQEKQNKNRACDVAIEKLSHSSWRYFAFHLKRGRFLSDIIYDICVGSRRFYPLGPQSSCMIKVENITSPAPQLKSRELKVQEKSEKIEEEIKNVLP